MASRFSRDVAGRALVPLARFTRPRGAHAKVGIERVRPPNSGRTRAGYIGTSQILVSISNFGLTVAALRLTNQKEFGAFAVAFTVYQFAASTERAAAGDTLIMSLSGPEEGWWQSTVIGLGISLVVGVVAMLVLGVFALTVSTGNSPALLIFAVFMPLLMAQDYLRLAAVALHRPQIATMSDGIWLTLEAAGFAAVAIIGGAGMLTRMTAVWVVGGAIAALASGAVILGHRRSPRGIRWASWGAARVSGSRALIVEHLLSSGGLYLALSGVAFAGGLVAIGTVRAALVLASPLQLGFQAAQTFMVPELKRRHLTRRPLNRRLLGLFILFGVVALLMMVAVLVLPGRLGEIVFSDKWLPAKSLIAPLTLYLVAEGAIVAVRCGVRAMGWPQLSAWARLVMLPLIVALGIVGAQVGGAKGAMWGFGISSAVAAVVAMLLWLRRLNEVGVVL